MAEYKDGLEHIILPNSAATEGYKYPYKVTVKTRIPPRQIAQHAAHLKGQIESIKNTITQMRESSPDGSHPQSVVLEFKSENEYDLVTKSLETKNGDLTLLNVREDDSKKIYATVRVKNLQALEKLEKKIEQYRTETTKTGNPKNKPLVETISDIELAKVKAFWTDPVALFPSDTRLKIWWEIWLLDEDNTVEKFHQVAVQRMNLRVSDRQLHLVDRIVLLLESTAEELEILLQFSHQVSEVRRAIEIAPFFQLNSTFMNDQLQAFAAMVSSVSPPSIFVTLLDTGVNRGHPLLASFIQADDVLTCDSAWNVNDHNGHGSQMAGLSLYGDLLDHLSQPRPTSILHALESVKILPPAGQTPNPPDLYGAVTILAAQTATTNKPQRQRFFCMPVTDRMTMDRGKPSSWSAAIDAICFGNHTGKKQLFFISAGNMSEPGKNYIQDNLLESIHDPGQSWNAVTVGAYTNKQTILDNSFSGWSPLAPEGGLCPASTTSNTWATSWPLKPEVVFEGGNMAYVEGNEPDFPNGLSLVTTGHQTHAPLVEMGETSAATAQAARFAAILQSNYPQMWPETIRALMVHSASWTQNMLNSCAGFPDRCSKTAIGSLIRTYGYGVPSIQRAMHSATDNLTLVIEQDFEPYILDENNEQKRQINYHSLPWPIEVLEQELNTEKVRLRLTLAYFIDPNPARRDRQPKHLYRSFGLRFAVKSPLESVDEFKRKINGISRNDGELVESVSDASHWLLGDQKWNGSIHSDTWTGTGAQLAACGLIAIYPVNGWWKDKFDSLPDEKRKIRYSLILSIETEKQDVDIYTPVLNQVAIVT